MAKKTFYCRTSDHEPGDEYPTPGSDAEEAAIEYARRYDSKWCEYPDERTIIVLDGDTETRFCVTGYVAREYAAKEIQAGRKLG